jgi:opacity protein-like surface antigen
MRVKTLTLSLIAAGALSPSATAEDLERPRFQLVFSGGGSAFRGGTPDGVISSALPFQPDVTAPTGAAAFAVRAIGALALEAEFAHARGRQKGGVETPNNTFVSGGLSYPWLTINGGRLVCYVAAGGGIVTRKSQDAFQRTIERAFEVRETDPTAYAGAGVEWRLNRVFGVRADYRYLRIFPGDADGLRVERKSYGPHRFMGGLSLSY